MRHAVILPILLVAALGGCVGGDDHAGPPGDGRTLPAATLWCVNETKGPRCNFEATLTPATRQANELSIAVNPTNPLNILATGKDYTPEEAGDCVWSGIYTTKDGGATWKNQNVPGSPWKKLNNPAAPANEDFSKFWCATDPVVAFGPDGTAYWTVMPYQCDRASGSKTGRGTLPSGGFNDWFWTCSAMYVLVSRDGGDTWPEWKQVAFGPRLEHDKQWIATAPNGNVLLCWDRDSNYQVDQGTAADQLTPGDNTVVCSVSRDKGKTWDDGQPSDQDLYATMNTNWVGYLPAVDYDAFNTAYATLLNSTHVLVTVSPDGLRWATPVAVGTYTDPDRGGEYNWPVLRGSAFRNFAVPLIAIDRSDGPYGGTIYVTWFDHGKKSHADGEGDIRVAYSRDGGKTWNESARPHDDDPTKKADQFFPAISVGPDGTVDLSWWDRRDDPNNHLFHLYYTYSKDGGATWAKNLRVTDEASDEQYSRHQNGMIFLGDYRDQDSSTMGAHLVWVDTRNQKADVYTAIVER
ncbi:MAG TPA: sialidase family protein [Candidatus Thermoplasmatota archaeon]|nr:sialidase family protein [Candidatus Thermoplasmatota archaeon]